MRNEDYRDFRTGLNKNGHWGASKKHMNCYIREDGTIGRSTGFYDGESSGYFKTPSDLKKAIDKYHEGKND